MGAEQWSEFDTLRAELECAQVLTRFVGHLDRREYRLAPRPSDSGLHLARHDRRKRP